MATANKPTEKVNLPAEVPRAALATLAEDAFAADAGAGMEGATSESFAIPFLGVLQKGSPQVDEADGAFVEGAKAGLFFENVTGRLYDGKTGVLLVPCAYRRTFLRWGARGEPGAGFKGEIAPEEVAQMRAEGKIVDLDGRLFVPLPDGTVNDKKCDSVRDTRNHYVLLIDEQTGAWTQALVSLVSTQIKKSKMLMSALASVKLVGAAGTYTPPTFANLVRCHSVPESNDKGTWHGVKFELAGRVDRTEVYAAAKAFHASVAKGVVEAKYEDAPSAPADDRF
jgi:hypothetical protein